MRREQVLKYLLDIEQAIGEIEQIAAHYDGNFKEFQKDWIAIRALERIFPF